MQIVIDIQDDIYEQAINGTEYDTLSLGIKLRESVREGVVIPKGHGRLIDADAYISKHEECGLLDDIAINEFNAITPTIIDADKESEGE